MLLALTVAGALISVGVLCWCALVVFGIVCVIVVWRRFECSLLALVVLLMVVLVVLATSEA